MREGEETEREGKRDRGGQRERERLKKQEIYEIRLANLNSINGIAKFRSMIYIFF